MRFLAHACIFALVPVSFASADFHDVATVLDRTSHRASSHDVTGGNDDSLVSFAPGETRILLDTDGPGRITHIWMTLARFPGHEFAPRDVVLRIYWEHSPVPSVEVPLGDFFGLGHGRLYAYQSRPMAVGGNPAAMNCYWPMPFQKHARVELFNAGTRSIRRLYYNLDYELGKIPADQGLFHALYRRERLAGQSFEGNTTGEENYVILETEGRGQYVGCTLSVDAQPGGWWGEGDEMIFIDHADKPSIIGTGSEDYFCNAWGYKEAFSYPYYGAPLLVNEENGRKLATVYRWHVPDPVRFKRHIKVTIEHLWEQGLLNDYTSVAYWYQTEPVKQRQPLPPAAENQPRSVTEQAPVVPADQNQSASTRFDVDGTELEPDCLARGIKARSITANLSEGYTNGGWLQIHTGGEPVELHLPVPGPGTYRVLVKPVNHLLDQSLSIGLADSEARTAEKIVPPPDKPWTERNVPYVDLGTGRASGNTLAVIVSGSPTIGIDGFRIVRAE